MVSETAYKKILVAATSISILFIIIVLLLYGFVEKPTISINYNVGEIVGGSLVGISAVIASLTYALRPKKRNKKKWTGKKWRVEGRTIFIPAEFYSKLDDAGEKYFLDIINFEEYEKILNKLKEEYFSPDKWKD